MDIRNPLMSKWFGSPSAFSTVKSGGSMRSVPRSG